jgi:hypothetical protein
LFVLSGKKVVINVYIKRIRWACKGLKDKSFEKKIAPTGKEQVELVQKDIGGHFSYIHCDFESLHYLGLV